MLGADGSGLIEHYLLLVHLKCSDTGNYAIMKSGWKWLQTKTDRHQERERQGFRNTEEGTVNAAS